MALSNLLHLLAAMLWIGGMLFATLLGLLMIPVFFVVVRRMLGDKLDEPSKEFMERQRDADAAHRPDR